MATPPQLVGKGSAFTDQAFRAEIKEGLKMRCLPEAQRLRHIYLGKETGLVASLEGASRFSLSRADACVEGIDKGAADPCCPRVVAHRRLRDRLGALSPPRRGRLMRENCISMTCCSKSSGSQGSPYQARASSCSGFPGSLIASTNAS
jgi:hypothetical protein